MAVINPLQINAYSKTGIRKAKTDPMEAFWIADLLRFNRTRPNQIPEAVRLQLRELSPFRFSFVDRIGDLKRKLTTPAHRRRPLIRGQPTRGANCAAQHTAARAAC